MTPPPPPPPRACPELEAEARATLDRYPWPPIGPLRAVARAGGLGGARLWAFETRAGPMMLRLWPWPETTAARLEWLHGRIARIARFPFVAAPLADRSGATFARSSAGRFWEVAVRLPGAPDLGTPPAPARLDAGIEALAAIHDAFAGEARIEAPPGLVRKLRELGIWRAGRLEERARTIAGDFPRDEAHLLARRWLERAAPLASRVEAILRAGLARPATVQTCLRDVRAEHLLFEGDRLRGLIDYGAADEDSPAADLARLLADWTAPESTERARAMTRYGELRPGSSDVARLVPVYERTADWFVGAAWVDRGFPREGSSIETETLRDALRRALDRLDKLERAAPPPIVV